MKRTLILMPLTLILLSMVNSPGVVRPWNEEKTDSLGPAITSHSRGEEHSTVHYDLTRFLARMIGLSADTAETIARFCALVDQINPKAGYPYTLSLNSTSIPDTFALWPESLAGTERGGLNNNAQNEYTAQYWHFPFRDPADSLTGDTVWGRYPVVSNFSHFTGPPHFWRVPITYNLKNIMKWALYGGGEPGLPDQLTPVQVMYADANSSGYQIVQQNSIQAFAIFLHSLADSYSHEECMVTDTIRAHPSDDPYCGLTYHSEHEFAYDVSMRAKKHADSCVHALWRCLREFKRIHNITSPAIWTEDDNGFQDGDGIPDQLEDDGDADTTETFLEQWKNPAAHDYNGDGVINHYDHTTWRIHMCSTGYQRPGSVAINSDGSEADPSAALDVKAADRGMLIPRVTSSSRDLISSPVTGLMIYNTTTLHFNYYNGSEWYQAGDRFVTNTTGTLHPGGGVMVSASPASLPEDCAVLDISDPGRGIGLPVTTTQLILAPAAGLIIYDTAAGTPVCYNGSKWMKLCAVTTGVPGGSGSGTSAGVAIRGDCSGPPPSAILNVSAADRGILVPRLTDSQRDQLLPVAGLFIYNTSDNNLQFYNGTSWNRINTDLVASPSAGTHVPARTQITWKWNPVAEATGYRWNTVNDYATSMDMGTATEKTETGLTCSTAYNRYVWACNLCGFSAPVIISQQTLACFACGESLAIIHTAGNVAPVTKTVTYGTITGIPDEATNCWITSNLGSDHQAVSVDDATEPPAGWYWQFNRKQGYKHDGTTRIPNSVWITSISEDLDWQSANDPCAVELGDGWRIPTKSEWTNADADGGWNNWNGPWSSGLMLHAAGSLQAASGSLANRGSEGYYWSNKESTVANGWHLRFNSGQSNVGSAVPKASGFPVRCIK